MVRFLFEKYNVDNNENDGFKLARTVNRLIATFQVKKLRWINLKSDSSEGEKLSRV